MSPASYRTAPPRVGASTLGASRRGLKSAALLQQVQRPRHLDPGPVAEGEPSGGLPLLQRLVRLGEVRLRLLEQRLRLRPGALGRVLAAFAGVLGRGRG